MATTAPVSAGLGQPAIEDAPLEDGDAQLWSVTTIIGALDKPALLYWAAEQAAIAALGSQRTWQGMLADDNPDCTHTDAGHCPVVKWLRDARFRRPKGMRSATELGELVHQACEAYALTGTRPEVDEEVQPFLEAFDGWLQRFGPSYQATEVAVYHPDLGYAGTSDAFLTIDGVRYIADYKSTRKAVDDQGRPTKPYPEQVGLQLAAYRHARYAAIWRPRRLERFRRRYYLLGPAERAMAEPVPEVDTGLVIHITPESCEAFPIRCDEQVFEAYLAAQDSARWLFQDSRGVMGEPLVPTREGGS
jgi:hypothetical protein